MKHNTYFDGKVQSLGINTTEGYATVGVIEAGQYSFGTESEEHMHVVVGVMKAKLPGRSWQEFPAGETLVVPPHVTFDVEADADVAYVCYYK